MENDAKAGRRSPLILAGLVAALAVGVGTIVALNPASASSLATVKALEPAVTVQEPGDLSPKAVTAPVTVEEGTDIHTDETGVAEISYFDGSLTRVGPDSEYELSTLDDASGRAIVGNLQIGSTFHRVAELSGSGDRFDVRTGTAVAAVRGTRFIVTCTSADACIVSVIDGVVEVTNRITGTEFTLRECQKGDALQRFSDEEPLDMIDIRPLDPTNEWLLLNLGLEGITLEELEEDCPNLFGSETDSDADDSDATPDAGDLAGTEARSGSGSTAFAGSRTRGSVPVGGGGTTGGGGVADGGSGGGTPTSSTQPEDEVLGEVVDRPDDSTTTTARPGRGSTTTRPGQGTSTTRPGQSTTTTRPGQGTTSTQPPATTSTTRPAGTTSTTQACTTGYPPRPC